MTELAPGGEDIDNRPRRSNYPPAVPTVTLSDVGYLSLGATDQPLLSDVLTLVDLDDRPTSPAVFASVAKQLRESSRVLVGVTSRRLPVEHESVLAALTCTISTVPQQGPYAVVTADLAKTVEHLASTVGRSPIAATVLAGVLRNSTVLPVRDALVAESLAFSTLLAGPEFAAWRARSPARPRVTEGEHESVHLERRGDLLRLVLDAPARRNALGRAMRDHLVDALTVAALDEEATTVELSALGPAFCSGGDLDEFGTARDPASAHVLRTAHNPALMMHACAERMVVRLHGACFGAGIELPAFAARVTARPGTVFRLPEVAMGLIPGSGGTVSIPRRIGRWRTAYWALSGVPVDVAQAHDWGLVDEIVGR